MNENKRGDRIFWILLIIIIVILLVFSIIAYEKGVLAYEKEYYKGQMLNFCELTLIQKEIIFELGPEFHLSKIEPCDYWVID